MSNQNLSRSGEYSATPDDLARAAMDDVEPKADAVPAEAPDNRDPIEKWREGLKVAGITEEQAGTILDSMLARGYWEREYRLFHGRVVLKLRTRDAANLNRVLAMIDRLRLPTQGMIEEQTAYLNLVASMVQLNSVTLPHPDISKSTSDEIEDAFNKREEFVRKVSGPLMPAIRKALHHFDTVVAAALADGAAEGF